MFFLASKCCFPALLRTIFPRPVTLNRFADAYTRNSDKIQISKGCDSQIRHRGKRRNKSKYPQDITYIFSKNWKSVLHPTQFLSPSNSRGHVIKSTNYTRYIHYQDFLTSHQLNKLEFTPWNPTLQIEASTMKWGRKKPCEFSFCSLWRIRRWEGEAFEGKGWACRASGEELRQPRKCYLTKWASRSSSC